jgi:hypothetical protein
MSYLTRLTDGSGKLEIGQGDRVTSIAGSESELYLVDVAPYAQGHPDPPPIQAPVKVMLEKFYRLNPVTFAPEYRSAVEVYGQAKTEKAKRREKEAGADSPVSKEYLYFDCADFAMEFRLFKAELADELNGMMFANLFTVKLILTEYIDKDEDAGIDGASDKTIIPLICKVVDTNDQVENLNGIAEKKGDARLVIRRGQATQAQLEAGRISLQVVDGEPVFYTVVNERGVKHLLTYHDEIFLQKEDPES